MKAVLCIGFLFAAGLRAQLALHLDLTGDWRLHEGDDAEWARPGFGDAQWTRVDTPAASQRWTRAWLRRSFWLPEGAEKRSLVLTLGGFAKDYQVFLNGIQIGEVPQPVSYPRARLYDLPPVLVRVSAPNVLALRVRPTEAGFGAFSVMPDPEPFVVTERSNAPVSAPRADRDARLRRTTPSAAASLVFGLLAFILVLLWLGDRRQIALIMLAGLLLLEARFRFYEYWAIVTESPPYTVVDGPLRMALCGLLALDILGIRFRAGWAVLLGLAVVRSFFPMTGTGGTFQIIFFYALTLAQLAVLIWRWDRLSGQRALAVISCLLACLNTFRIPGPLRIAYISWDTGGMYVRGYDICVALLAAVMIVLLVRRLIDDRREKRRLTMEMEAARSVQQLLLPSAGLAADVWQLDVVYEPAQEVGGDFYFVTESGGGSRVLVTGDVSGKGLKAAMLVSVLVGLLRRETSESPAAILHGLNRDLASHIGDGAFVTCCCARFDADGLVTIANAGHPAPYLHGRELDLPAELPLGIHPEANYQEVTISGERLTFVSDGVVEAASAKGELFGFDRTRDISTRPAAEIAKAAKQWGQNDDITVVTVRRSA